MLAHVNDLPSLLSYDRRSFFRRSLSGDGLIAIAPYHTYQMVISSVGSGVGVGVGSIIYHCSMP